MRYEITEKVGDVSTTHSYEGTPEEIYDLTKLQESKRRTDLSKLTVQIDGSKVADAFREELDRMSKHLSALSKEWEQ